MIDDPSESFLSEPLIGSGYSGVGLVGLRPPVGATYRS